MGVEFCLLEAGGLVGGLARTAVHKRWRYDFGVKALCSQQSSVMSHLRSLPVEYVDENNRPFFLSPLDQEAEGVLEHWLERIVVSASKATLAAIVVRRDVYESLGAFDARLEHGADWDMWKRIAARFPDWYIPEVPARYRVYSHSDTSRLVRTGANVVDMRTAIHLSAEYLPPADVPRLKRLALRNCAREAANSAERLLKSGDRSAAFARIRESWKTYPSAWYRLKLLWVLVRQAG
jgi:hypothetical protein